MIVCRKFIQIGIVDDEEYEKTEDFYVELSDPIWAKNLSGKISLAKL